MSLSVQVLPNFPFPLRNYDSADRRPTVSVRPGGGGVGFVTWSPSRISDFSVPLYLSVLVGGVVADTWAPSCTPGADFSVHPGGEGWCCDQGPLAPPPDSAMFLVLPVKAKSLRGFQPECPL